MKREMVTICGALDAILEGNILRAGDVLCQRLKALELISAGTQPSIANRLEIMDDEYSVLASTQETRAATTEAYDEGRIAQRLSTGYRPMVTGQGLGLRDHQEKGGKKRRPPSTLVAAARKRTAAQSPSLVRVDQAPVLRPQGKGT